MNDPHHPPHSNNRNNSNNPINLRKSLQCLVMPGPALRYGDCVIFGKENKGDLKEDARKLTEAIAGPSSLATCVLRREPLSFEASEQVHVRAA